MEDNTRTQIKKTLTLLSAKKYRSSLSSRRRSKDASRLLTTSMFVTLDEKIKSYYPQTSLCCLSKKNKFRLFFITMVEHKWFRVTSYLTIIISTICMLVYTYSARLCSNNNQNSKECMTKYHDDISRDKVMDYIFIGINFVFLVEMFCKMIAQGLIMQKGSYLRNGWNILDCSITLYSFMEIIFPYFDKLHSLRFICLLRAIKSIENFKGLKRLIASIILSLPTLGNVLLFLGFVLLVFGTMGTQMFSGLLYNRCRVKPEVREMQNGTVVYYSKILLDSICSQQNDSFVVCPVGSQCVNFFNIPKEFNLSITIDNFTVLDDMLADSPKLKYGIPNFDTIFNSIINAFTLMTIQSWTEIVNILLDGSSFFPVTFYFNGLVISGGFFIIKLILAAQNEAMIKVRKEEIQQAKELKGRKNCETPTIIQACCKMKPNFEEETVQLNLAKIEDTKHKEECFSKENSSQYLRVFTNLNNRKILFNEEEQRKADNLNDLHKSKSFQESAITGKNKTAKIITNESNESGIRLNRDLRKEVLSTREMGMIKVSREIQKSYQNNRILIIEEQMFVHSCRDFQSLISTLLIEEPQEVDPYLKNLVKDINVFFTWTQIAVNKIKFLILEEYSSTYQYLIFNGCVYIMTILNLIFLCQMAYPMNDETLYQIELVNILCTSIFALEIAFKILVLGFKRFFKDALNIIDMAIVLLGFFEIIFVKTNSDPADDSYSSFSSIRAIRFIRILKLFKAESFIQQFVQFFLISLQDLLSYCLLLVFFGFLFSTSGRELFSNSIRMIVKEDEYHFYYEEQQSPRENFDTIINSFVTVFILFIGDNWPNIMYEYSRIYVTISKIYFCAIIIVGNIMLFNLFLSILLSNYDEENRHDLFSTFQGKGALKIQLGKIKEMLKSVKEFLHQRIEECLNCCQKESQLKKNQVSRRHGQIMNNGENNTNTSMIGNFGNTTNCEFTWKTDLSEMIPLERTSLYLFPTTSKFRRWCHWLITKSLIFKYSLIINILISLVILAFDTPTLSDESRKKILLIFDIITTIFFLFETALKSIAFGFLFNGDNSYLRYEYNFIDFASVLLSASYIISISFHATDTLDPNAMLSASLQVKTLGVIKILRIIRVMKIVSIFTPLQSALSAFYQSLKQMLKIILIGMLFILVFSLFCVTYFRGRFYRCDFQKVPRHLMKKVETKWDCIDYGGNWINPYPNFDNIKSSLTIFFEMMTTEGWTSYMFKAIDATSVNFQPIRDSGYSWSLFFILYMVFAYFFLFNLAIVILSENYQKEKQKIENYKFPHPIQNEFFHTLKNLYQVPLPTTERKTDTFTKFLVNIIDSTYFDVVISACIISNLLILMLRWPGMDEKTLEFIDEMCLLLNCVFIGEAVLKIVVYGLNYFKSPWNLLDFFLAFETMISLFVQAFDGDLNQFMNMSILRALRVGRIMRLLKKAHSLNKVFNLFINSIPGVINVVIMYFLLLYIYSIIGMSIFSSVKYQSVISMKWNFRNFYSAFLMLIRVTTGEGWNIIMHEYSSIRTGDFFCKYKEELTEDEYMNLNIACGTLLAYPYFLSFVILANMMFLEFFSVIIASAMSDTYVICLEELKKGHITKFQRKWAIYDKDCTGFMPMDVFQRFLYDIGYPLGISTLKVTDYVRICSLMNISTYHSRQYIFFYDVLTELAKYYLIHKNVEDQCAGQEEMFSNPKEMMREKIECFIEDLLLVSKVQEDRVYQMLNPYGKNEKFKRYEKDEFITEVSFSSSKNLLLHHSWALRKISCLIRCYKNMKIKCLVLIKSNVIRAGLHKYASAYIQWINSDLNSNKNKNSSGNTEIIQEQLIEGSSSRGNKEDDGNPRESVAENSNMNGISNNRINNNTSQSILKNDPNMSNNTFQVAMRKHSTKSIYMMKNFSYIKQEGDRDHLSWGRKEMNIYNLDFGHLIDRNCLKTKSPMPSTSKKKSWFSTSKSSSHKDT